jgi:thiamine transport system permease protein
MSAVVALVLGYPIGNWLAGLRRLRRVVTAIILLPFLLPAFLVGLAFRPILGGLIENASFGILAVIMAHAFMNAGFIAVVSASSMVPKDQVEAAHLDGATRFQTRLRIQLPQQLPALSAAGLLVALYSATSFGLVITLGQGSVQTLETQIAISALQELDLQTAGWLAALQTLMTVLFFALSKRLGAEPTTLFGELEPQRTKSALGGLLGAGLIGLVVLVAGGVFARATSSGPGFIENFSNLSSRGSRDILNISVFEAAGNSLRNLVLATVISLLAAWFLSAKKVGLGVLAPVGISPVVIGLGALVLSGYLPSWLATSWVLLPIVQSVFLIPLAFQIISPARKSLSSELVEAANLDGANGIQLFGFVELPTLRKPLLAATAIVSLGSLGEFGAASFLAYGSDATLPLVMFRLMSRPGAENLGMAMAAASIFIVLALVVVWAISSAQTERRDFGAFSK